MRNQTFRTQIEIEGLGVEMTYNRPLFLLGSCFAQTMAARLEQARLPHLVNTHGILFNPISIASAINDVVYQRSYHLKDLEQLNGQFFSWCHHGDFKGADAQVVLDQINASLDAGFETLQKASHVIITLGTSEVFQKDGIVVGNCHKAPGDWFQRRMLSQGEVESALQQIITNIRSLNATAEIVFTVSPVRYKNIGAIGNSRSKARLLLAIEEVISEKNGVRYFPAFEIMMDELRDYRFYADDMMHPSKQAKDYIFDAFMNSAASASVMDQMEKIKRFTQSLLHRPITSDSEQLREFYKQRLSALEAIRGQFPTVDFSGDEVKLKARLEELE